jgi:hypothetical protein
MWPVLYRPAVQLHMSYAPSPSRPSQCPMPSNGRAGRPRCPPCRGSAPVRRRRRAIWGPVCHIPHIHTTLGLDALIRLWPGASRICRTPPRCRWARGGRKKNDKPTYTCGSSEKNTRVWAYLAREPKALRPRACGLSAPFCSDRIIARAASAVVRKRWFQVPPCS